MTHDLHSLHEAYVMPTYKPGMSLVKGAGSRVVDSDGNEYLDFIAGIGVLNVGHCHPRVTSAIQDQAATLMHVSNLYVNEHQPRLAEALVSASFPGKVFFCNSGAEANEAAIKLMRYFGSESGRQHIVTMKHSFHGRTLAAITATGQPQYQKGFEPLPGGFSYAEFNDLESVKASITSETIGVMIEVVQGEGGVIPGRSEFLEGLRALCDEKELLLCVDEVQTGLGRTGELFGYQSYGITPDLMTLAKGLGGGFPIGALVAGTKVADVLQPGTHASTFGGTPLACAAARAVLSVIEEENLCDRAKTAGADFRDALEAACSGDARVESVRGLGLMIGVVLNVPAAELTGLLMERGLIALATAGNVVRFLPPLTTRDEEFEEALNIFKEALAAWPSTSENE